MGGGAPPRGHPGAGSVRPPKSRFFKTNQTPLELGKCLGLGKGKGLGTDKHRHKGKGKDTGQVGKITHSRRRAKRGGGSAAPPGTSVLDHTSNSLFDLHGISVQSLCPSLFKPLHSPPRGAHFPRRPLILVRPSASWRASWSKKLPSKTSSNKFQKMWFFLRKNNDF